MRKLRGEADAFRRDGLKALARCPVFVCPLIVRGYDGEAELREQRVPERFVLVSRKRVDVAYARLPALVVAVYVAVAGKKPLFERHGVRRLLVIRMRRAFAARAQCAPSAYFAWACGNVCAFRMFHVKHFGCCLGARLRFGFVVLGDGCGCAGLCVGCGMDGVRDVAHFVHVLVGTLATVSADEAVAAFEFHYGKRAGILATWAANRDALRVERRKRLLADERAVGLGGFGKPVGVFRVLLLHPHAGREGGAYGSHEMRGVGAHGFHAAYQLECAQHGIRHERASLHHHARPQRS